MTEYFEISLRGQVMIAHSLKHPDFGIANNKHGATFVVEWIIKASRMDKMNTVFNIEIAERILKKELAKINYQDLDDLFPGELTTTEWLARHLWQELNHAISNESEISSEDLLEMTIKLGESPTFWASYTRSLR